MDEGEARRILRTLQAELTETNAAAEAARRRVAALEKLISGYHELFPGLLAVPAAEGGAPDEKPRGQDAVLRILADPSFKGRYWTVGAVVGEMAARDWLPESKGDPANAVRTALARLEAHPSVRKGRGSRGTVVYFYRHEGMAEPHFDGVVINDPEALWEVFGDYGSPRAS